MPFNWLLLPLLAGYFFTHVFNFTKYRAKQLDGYRLLLESAGAGAFFLLCARALVLAFTSMRGSTPHAIAFAIAPFPYAPTLILSLALAVTLATALNLVPKRIWIHYAVERYGSDLLKLLDKIARDSKPALISLHNERVYIGIVTGLPSLEPGAQYLRILPLASGFRDKESKRVIFTTDYMVAYTQIGKNPEEFSEIDLSDFHLVLPLESVCGVTAFSFTAFTRFFRSAEPTWPGVSAANGSSETPGKD